MSESPNESIPEKPAADTVHGSGPVTGGTGTGAAAPADGSAAQPSGSKAGDADAPAGVPNAGREPARDGPEVDFFDFLGDLFGRPSTKPRQAR